MVMVGERACPVPPTAYYAQGTAPWRKPTSTSCASPARSAPRRGVPGSVLPTAWSARSRTHWPRPGSNIGSTAGGAGCSCMPRTHVLRPSCGASSAFSRCRRQSHARGPTSPRSSPTARSSSPPRWWASVSRCGRGAPAVIQRCPLIRWRSSGRSVRPCSTTRRGLISIIRRSPPGSRCMLMRSTSTLAT